jgi:hypothetical protein
LRYSDGVNTTTRFSASSDSPPASRPRRRRLAAFTIIEVATSAAIMAMVISTSIIVLQRGFASLDTARCLSYASQILQSEFEKVRLTTWGDGTAAGNGTTGVTAIPTTATALTIDANYYSAGDVGTRMRITRKASDVHTGMILITYTVSWNAYDGHKLVRNYFTYYGKDGIYDFIAL